ncbi:hypothetical protein G6F40_016920 [Rhizopus arrhizus]|nr:hypothetical protein G6F40_016920 [Rhizopus arrhizus]
MAAAGCRGGADDRAAHLARPDVPAPDRNPGASRPAAALVPGRGAVDAIGGHAWGDRAIDPCRPGLEFAAVRHHRGAAGHAGGDPMPWRRA